ncbi:MAG: DUF1080 domain-containing protein [Verrucomicrobia bacterium]|nr:DUF1080 domain-containing protein [Verrucomicrobiota bacterium]
MMHRKFLRFLWTSGLTAALLPLRAADATTTTHNQLAEAERAAGWRLLFDGQTTAGWRGFKKPGFPDRGWLVEEGCLKHGARAGGGDIITEATFDEFDFQFEWRIGQRANSGVKYFITESRGGPVGHEYQVIDDVAQGYRLAGDKHRTGTFYDVLPLQALAEPKPPGAFNQSRIVVADQRVEHWLNGAKILEYELNSDALRAAIDKSKFKDVPGFGTRFKGHLLLQDHGGEVWYRNLKIRTPAPSS